MQMALYFAMTGTRNYDRKYALPGPGPEMQINACNQRVARFPMKHTRGALLTYAYRDVWEKWYRRTCNHTDRYTDR